MLSIYAVAIAAVVASTVWRVLRSRWPSRWALRLVPPVAACLVVVSVGSIALASLRFQPKPWNASAFTDTLSGRVLRDLGVTRGIISLAGTGSGEQRVLVRADLLIRPQQIEDTSFQMEFLPSGMLCLGSVTHVRSFSFDARCRASDGSRRVVFAHWSQSSGPGFTNGTLRVHA
jgi:hypothetical protein